MIFFNAPFPPNTPAAAPRSEPPRCGVAATFPRRALASLAAPAAAAAFDRGSPTFPRRARNVPFPPFPPPSFPRPGSSQRSIPSPSLCSDCCNVPSAAAAAARLDGAKQGRGRSSRSRSALATSPAPAPTRSRLFPLTCPGLPAGEGRKEGENRSFARSLALLLT